MKAVLCGYGVVGKGVETLCKTLPDLTIQTIFVRKEKERLPRYTNDLNCVEDPAIDIVFECLNGLEPAYTLVKKALTAKKHVITSNKALVATYLDEFLNLCQKHGSTLQIEACVAGGIPFLDALLKLGRAEKLNGYEGLFNGTTNFILDAMQKDGKSYEEVLKTAQAKGYAEKDPKNDVEGIDAWYKAKIANSLAYHCPLLDPPSPFGISHCDQDCIELAKKHDAYLRHIVLSQKKDGVLSTVIAPAYLSSHHFLAHVPSNYNAQLIYAHSFEQLGYYGQGAGQLPTASAMIQNALDLLEGHIRPIQLSETLTLDKDQKHSWLIHSANDLSYLPIERKEKNFYWTKPISQDELNLEDPDAFVALWRLS